MSLTEKLMKITEHDIGTPIKQHELNEAKRRAEQKLQQIIRREGDANGCRRDPCYHAQLIAEALREMRYSRFTKRLNIIETKEKPAAVATSNSKTSVSIVSEYI